MKGNYKGVIDRIKAAADNGDADSQFILAAIYEEILYLEDDKLKEAFKYYKLAAENGIAEAQYKLGDIYYYNELNIIKKANFKLAFKYYKLAADNGYPDAQYKVGSIYEDGMQIRIKGEFITFVPENKKESLKYYKLAADNGVVEALIRVIEICLHNDNNNDFEKYYAIARNNKDEDTRNYAHYLAMKRKEKKR